MKKILTLFATCSLMALLHSTPASAQSMYGALSNFDVFNDAGEDAHGFEIELDGLTSSDISSYFGSPNTQYGNPVIVNFNGGVYVRYMSPWDATAGAFTITTPIATNMSNTGGHACWYGGVGGPAPYPSAGCEHFGISTGRNATAIKYRWLVADTANPGGLIAHTPDVSIPSVTYSTTPNPVPNNPPVVVAAVEPPEAAAGWQFSDAYWVKTYVTQQVKRVALSQLVTDNPVVPNLPSETEMSWEIYQRNPNLSGLGKLVHSGGLAPFAFSIIRRFEFYKYTGAYSSETHEALCQDPNCNTPGANEIGDLLGVQMSAVNFTKANQAPATLQVIPYKFVYDPVAKTFSGLIVIKNTDVTAVTGPVEVVFTGLPPRTTLASPSGKFLTYPYALVPALSTSSQSLPAGGMTYFNVVFNNVAKAFRFTSTAYLGAF